MSDTMRPETLDQLRDAVAWAVAEETPLEIVARGTKRGLGRTMQTDHTLDTSAFSGISLYEADELVMSAGPGTMLAEIEAALAAQNQQLAFEPGDWGPLLGQPAGMGSIAGIFACNIAGPRRLKAGAARDHILGFKGVSGRGEIYKAGSRVVKNVTGYDLPKLFCSAYGTLTVASELTFKVLPAPEKTYSVLILGLDDATAASAMALAMTSPHEVSAAAHLPAGITAGFGVSYVREAGAAVTAIRVEGPGPSVEHRCRELRALLAGFGQVEELHTHNSLRFWRELADVAPFAARPDMQLWRVSVAPLSGPVVAAALPDATYYFDWAGGLVWLGLPPAPNAHADAVRAAVAATGGGHATLIRAAADVRATVPVFQPQDAALAALSRRVKDSFDPRGVLNPGRLYPGA
ncbi:MAG: FAD-binding protein [Alphaproteobacteria bacterium]|nr:FAD-binding protein [Alphaproteobacteria bacterium]MBU0795905.1 FAD-binding protein [Alphaproteobacteria bacterium]MBU0886942.1 FAD-binding protein [Alphaproteobacteria bacterium]MBU1813202.1 FAD-binding protein [Alphaproteobacteria bacterium]